MAYELGKIRTDRGEFLDKGNLGVDVRHPDFAGGARGDSLHNDSFAFADASTFADAAGMGLVIGPGDYKISADITIAAGVHLMAGAMILPDAGVTVTFAGPFSASASQHFETGAGSVAFSTASTVEAVNILWWGAVADSGTTDCYAAIHAAIVSLHDRGGTLYIPNGYGEYFGTSECFMFAADNGYSNLTIRGEGAGSWIKHTADNTDVEVSKAVFQFTGENIYELKNMRVEHVRISGNSPSDLTKILYFGNADGVVVDHLYFDSNGIEGVYFNSPRDTKNVWVTNCDGRDIGKLGWGGLSAINLNALNAHCHNNTLYDVGQGIEHTGYGLNITGNNFSKCKVYGMLLLSTWSGWLDAEGEEQNSQRVIVDGNIIDGVPVGIIFGDAGGHTVGEQVYSGNMGKAIISNNIFMNCAQAVNVGMDGDNVCLILDNLFEGASAATAGCVVMGPGATVVRGNVFKRGATQWAYLVRADSTDGYHVIENNVIDGAAWTTVAFLLGGTKAILRNNLFVPHGDNIGGVFLRIGQENGFQQISAGSTFTQGRPVTYSGQVRSEWYGFAEPDVLTWKRADLIENSAPASTGYMAWLCTVAGTAGTLNSSATTGDVTSGSDQLTLSATTGLYPGAMITVAGVTGSFTILDLDYTNKIATLDGDADATVDDAAVAYKAPTFKTAGLIS